MTHRHAVTTPDGFDLVATAFGDSRTCRAGVLIVPAMGVEQHFYAAFAHWLAQQGFFVVSFDYRGMGHSRPSQYRRSLRGFEADVFAWAQRDCAAMVDFVAARIGVGSRCFGSVIRSAGRSWDSCPTASASPR